MEKEMESFEIDDLEVTIAPAGASDAVVGIPCFIVARVLPLLL